MARARGFVLFAAAGLVTLGSTLPECSPEELIYERSGTSPDGAAGDGTAGIGDGNTWAEICGNGIDDDNNGKTDCEDPACSSYACVDTAPAGWNGPVALYQGTPAAIAQCPAGLSDVYDGNADPKYAPAQCSTCSCGAPMASGCNVDVTYYADSACATTLVSSSVAVGAGCGAGYAGTVGSVAVATSPSGSCGAGSGSTPTLDPPTWNIAARACAPAKGGSPAGCSGGKVCAPLSSDALACVYQTGEVSCPAGYPARHVFYSSFDDSRGCGSCPCNFAADGCSATVHGYSDTGCTAATFSTATAGCQPGATNAVDGAGGSVVNPRCEAGAGAPTGCVAPATATTLCCSGYAGTPCPSAHGPAMVQVPASGGGSYCIDSTEVTRAQYDEFLATNPSTASQPAECAQWNTSFQAAGFGQGASDSPVTYIDWCDAYAYCAWAGKRLCGKIGGGALATASADDASQSQWFDACSDGGTRKYPYGDTLIQGACGTSGFLQKPVKSYPCCQGGVAGLYDMVGGAREWIDSCQVQGTKGDHDSCVLESGSSCAGNTNVPRNRHETDIGFRCCAP